MYVLTAHKGNTWIHLLQTSAVWQPMLSGNRVFDRNEWLLLKPDKTQLFTIDDKIVDALSELCQLVAHSLIVHIVTN